MLAVVLSAGVIATVVVSRHVTASSRRTVAHGLISSENAAFFGDPRVRKEFGRHGLDVRVATTARNPDFALASNTSPPLPAVGHPSVVFSTPLVITAPGELRPALVQAGIARRRGGIWTFDLARYLALARDGKVPARIAAPAIQSSTGALFAAAAGVAAHGGRPLANTGDVDGVVNAVSPLFRPGAGSLIVGSGAQFPHPRPSTLLMYPDPDVVSEQALASFTAVGARAGHLLATDPRLQELAAQDGLAAPMPQVGAGVRPDLAVMAVPPYAILEALVNRVAATLVASGAANGARKP